MAISLHGNGTIATAVSAGSISVTVPTVSNGDMMLLCVSANGSPSSWNTPSGWTFVRTNTGTGGAPQQALFKRIAQSEPASYSVSLASGTANLTGQIRTYSGNSIVEDVDGGQGNASSTSDVAPSITLTNANEMVVGFWTWNSAAETSLSLPGGFGNSASLVSQAPAFLSGDEVFVSSGATGTQTATASSTAATNAGQMIALRQAPGDLSSSFFFHEWAYPFANFVRLNLQKFLAAAAPCFCDPSQRAVLGLGNVIINDLGANYWFSEFQPSPKPQDGWFYRRQNIEHDDFQSQLFTQPSAPVAGFFEQDARGPMPLVNREGWLSWQPFATLQIPGLQIPFDAGAPQLPMRFLRPVRYSEPSNVFIVVHAPFDIDVPAQLPIPPRRLPREDQHSRCVVIDIGDLLPRKPWPASTQSPWPVPTRPLNGVRDLVQPFDCSVFQPVQLPPMIPWDGGPAALPRAPAVRRFYGDLAGNIFPGIQPNTDQLGPWQAPQAHIMRTVLAHTAHSRAYCPDLPQSWAVETAVLGAWNAPTAFRPFSPRVICRLPESTPLPKLPDANEAILGAWQSQATMPRFPIGSAARLAAAADPLRTWGLVAESMAWFTPWADRHIIQAKRQPVMPIDHKNFLVSTEAPYFLIWDSGQQVPVRYPTSPARTHTTEAIGGLLAELPAGLIIVAGPYFVFQGQIYVAGAIQGDLSSE